MCENVIEIKHLKKSYNLYNSPTDRVLETLKIGKKSYHKEFAALNDITFDVKKGETLGIIGTNGAGKSTLLKIITGVLTPTAGSVKIHGRVSALLELGAGFNQECTGRENIYLNGRMMGYSRKEMNNRIDDIINFADIGDFIEQPVKLYSSGMFARLAFAVAINVEPDILIVDEALSVGDLFFQNKCFKKFDELKQKGVTILFVSHDISSVRQMCSRALWINKGQQVIFDRSDKVCDMYMDMKRRDMNELHAENISQKSKHLQGARKKGAVFPKISWQNSSIQTDLLKIESVFVTNEQNESVETIEVDKTYSFHVAVKLNKTIDNLIVGIVLENNKGIPLYDINNYISSGKVIQGQKGDVLEVIFTSKIPLLMKGTYMVSAAVAQGTQTNHVMLTWLHGVMALEILNPGYNSSYIELPTTSRYNIFNENSVRFE